MFLTWSWLFIYLSDIFHLPSISTLHSPPPCSVSRRLTVMGCINASLSLWLLAEFGQSHLLDWEVTVAEFPYQRPQILSRILFYSYCVFCIAIYMYTYIYYVCNYSALTPPASVEGKSSPVLLPKGIHNSLSMSVLAIVAIMLSKKSPQNL